MLCDGVEAEQQEEQRKEHAKEMNRIMDERLSKIKAQKQLKKEIQMEKSAHNSRDANSGILLREGTRVATEEEITAKVNRRKFVDLESID